MDYNFISVAEFRELDESGLLLESGTYDGRSGDRQGSCVFITVSSRLPYILQLHPLTQHEIVHF